jgi:hypothetical protein
MEEKRTGNGRARGWVLVKAESAQEVAEGLYKELGHEGGDSFVVVRADVVDFDYNIVIPVDAESQDMLYQVHDMIKSRSGVSETVIVRVEKHVPYPPHDAHGYITVQEAEAGKEPIEAGRQGASPGANPHG